MTQELFRREVLDVKRTSWLGEVSLAQPIMLWVLTSAAIFASLAVALFLTFGSYTRRSTVVGQLVPSKGMATVLAPATGVVSRQDVAEGESAAAGQALLVVTVPRATVASGSTAQALEQRLRQRQNGLQAALAARRRTLSEQSTGLTAQLQTAQSELAQLEAEIATQEGQVRIAKDALDRLRLLHESDYVSLTDVKQQQSTALVQVGTLQALQRQAIAARRTIVQIQQALRELPGQRQTAEADFQRDLAVLEQERVEVQARGELVVSSPVAGVVATQYVKPGEAVQEGQSLLAVLPTDGVLEAELLVPSRAIGFIESGDTVLLRYRAYPYQKFGHQRGRVSRVSRSVLRPRETSALNLDATGGEPLYRVTVALARQSVTAYGKQEPLRPGMLLDADVLGEKRRLIEWMFEPLFSLWGRLGS